MRSIKKILFAIADKDTEEYLSTVIREDCPNCSVIGIVTYKEKIIQKVSQLEPDILILRETLPGSLSITDILFELRYSYPNVRVIFLGGDRNPGDPLLLTLVTYGIYDLLVGGSHKISDVIELINSPNEFKDVNYLIPKASLNEFTNTMSFESPMVVSTKKQDIFVVEEPYNNYNNDKIKNHNIKKSFLKEHNNISIEDEKSKDDDFLDLEFDIEDEKSKDDDFLDLEFDIEDKKSKDDDFLDLEFDIEDEKSKDDDFLDLEFDIEEDEKTNNFIGNDIDEDFMLEIDIDDIKDNKDKAINDILHEDESDDDDIILLNNKTDIINEQISGDMIIDDINEQISEDMIIDDINEIAIEKYENKNGTNNSYTNKINSNKYQMANNIPLSNKKEDRSYDDLENLSKEIEEMRKDTSDNIDILNEDDLNPYTTNYNSNHSYKVENKNKDITDNVNQSLSFKSFLNKNSKQSTSKSSRQKIISFVGGKNGIGTSSIAINTAVNLAKQGNKVIYLEMDSKHPTIGYWYQMGHINQGIETAIKAVEKEELQKIDKSIIKSIDLKNQKKKIYKNLPDTLDFLLFSKQETILKTRQETAKPELLKDLFLLLMIELNYDFVILDLDFDLNNKYTITSLNFSNIIYPIVTQDISTLAYLVFKIEELERIGKNIKNKCRYIINKYESSGVQITLRDLKEWLDSKKVTVIPENNKEFINANASSIPIINYTRNEKIIKSFNDITKNILSDDF